MSIVARFVEWTLLTSCFLWLCCCSAANGKKCLSVHISKSDVSSYAPYIDAYIHAASKIVGDDLTIFLATHDADVVSDLLAISYNLKESMIQTQQPTVLQRPTNGNEIFREAALHHQTHRLNAEVLTHIYVLSKCDFLIHGKYVVAEGAIFVNPSLHYRSVNVEVPENKKTPKEFAYMVHTHYQSLMKSSTINDAT